MSITKEINATLGRYAGRIQRYDDIASIDAAVAAGFDIVQPKHDGQWIRVVVSGTQAKFFSRQCRHVGTRSVKRGCPSLTIIGEWMNGTQRATGAADEDDVLAFDIVALDGKVIAESLAYSRRLDIVDHLADYAEWLVPTISRPIAAASRLWDTQVLTNRVEGIVFRRSGDAYSDAVIGRLKRKHTADYVVMSVVEGSGRLAGMAGSLVCGLYAGGRLVEKCRIGGGMSADQRRDFWRRRDELRGAVIEARGCDRFVSGALRHPQFVRIRDDKKARDCVA